MKIIMYCDPGLEELLPDLLSVAQKMKPDTRELFVPTKLGTKFYIIYARKSGRQKDSIAISVKHQGEFLHKEEGA